MCVYALSQVLQKGTVNSLFLWEGKLCVDVLRLNVHFLDETSLNLMPTGDSVRVWKKGSYCGDLLVLEFKDTLKV